MVDKLCLGKDPMKPKIKLLLAALLAFGLVATGCSGDDGNNGDDGDTGTTEDASADMAEEDTSEEEDVEEDVVEDTDDEDTTSEDTAIDRVQVASLFYRRTEQSCPTSSCVFGVSINVISATLTKYENGMGRQDNMTPEDADMAIEDILGETTFTKMNEGWDCGTVDDPDVVHEFEARVWNGNDYEEKIQDVTGCLQDGSTAADAAEVQRIVTYLQDLRDAYFENQ